MSPAVWFIPLLGLVCMVFADDAYLQTREAMLKECEEKTGVKGGIDAYGKADHTEEEKCFSSCLMLKYGTLKTDGSLDAEKTKEFLIKHYESQPAIAEAIPKIVDDCIVEVPANPDNLCEAAHGFIRCRILKVQAGNFN